MGLWLLAMQESVQVARGDSRNRQEIQGAAYSGRQHRAGLVLVESKRRARIQQELSRPQRDGRSTPQRELPLDDLGLAILRTDLRRLRRHGKTRLVRRQEQVRNNSVSRLLHGVG